jgi:hypothetical protein
MSTAPIQLTAEGVIVDAVRRLAVERIARGQDDALIADELSDKALAALGHHHMAMPGGAELVEGHRATVRGTITAELARWRGGRN